MRLGVVQRKIPTFQQQCSKMECQIPSGSYIPNKIHKIVKRLTSTGLVLVVGCRHVMS